jgi:hypothetical protein
MSLNKSYASFDNNTSNNNNKINENYDDKQNNSLINRILSDPRFDNDNNYYNDPRYNTTSSSKNDLIKVSKTKKTKKINEFVNTNAPITNTPITNTPITNTPITNTPITNKNVSFNIPKTEKEMPLVKKINSFKIINFGKVNTRSDYLADVGLISPPYVITDQFQIIPFELVTSNIMKNEIINLLNKEFGHDIIYSEQFINNTWSGANVFYVMTSSDKSKFYGTIAVDRKNFYPYISQLYIVEDERCRNLGKHLINFANRYIKSLNFTQSRLWCENKLVNYYSKLGWYYEGKQKNLNIMVFDL